MNKTGNYPPPVQFLITGGTIDSHYDGIHDTVAINKESVIPDFVQSLKLDQQIDFSVICMKDSRDIAPADRAKLLKAIEASSCKHIIITHGTYTMPDTARYLKANLKRSDRVIILTGSMIPLLGFSPSDGPFSIGYCLSEIHHLRAGIYVCMNGHTFKPEEVVKELSEGRFSSVFTNHNPRP